MPDDPKHLRMIGCGLIVTYVVCLATQKSVPWWIMLPTVAFFFWRSWEQRTRRGEYWAVRLWRRWRKKPGTSLVLVKSKQDLVERKE